MSKKIIQQLNNLQTALIKAVGSIDDIYLNYCKENIPVDKKMHQVTKRMETAQKDIKKGEPKAAEKVLKKAEKKNEKLVKIDKNQRDPVMHSVEKATHKKGKALVPAVKKMIKAKAK